MVAVVASGTVYLHAAVDRVVAQTDAGVIRYNMIACEPDIAPDDCHAIEQSRIDRRVHRAWIDAAVRLHDVALTPAEAADVERETAASKQNIEKGAARFHSLAVAVLRIRRGESRAQVFTDISAQGITERELNWEIAHVRTEAEAERAARKDFVADGERATREYYTQIHELARLRDIVRRQAAAESRTFDEEEKQFWSHIAMATHTRILDPAFVIPEQKGILVSR